MSDHEKEREKAPSEFVTIRIPAELAVFVNQQAEAMCNSRAGVIRYALTQLRDAMEAGDRPPRATSQSQPEEVAA